MASGDEVLPAARETRPDVALLDIEMPPPVTLRARLGDGWLASGYNTTPSGFEDSLGRLYEAREAAGGSRGAFRNGIATMWRLRDRGASRRRADAGGRSRSNAGPPNRCAARSRAHDRIGRAVRARITADQEAGAERMFVWPLADELHQIERFSEDVVPLVAPPGTT